MVNWKALITECMDICKEGWSDVVYSTLDSGSVNVKFDEDYGAAEGCPFTLWTIDRVYFPVCYDGSEWVA